MTDPNAPADLEQGPGSPAQPDVDTGSTGGSGNPPQPPAGEDVPPRRPPHSLRDIMTEKVIVLSFRDLQLKRIGELQDNLLALSARAAANGSEAYGGLPGNERGSWQRF